MPTLRFLILIIPVLMLIACSSPTPRQPNWVHGQAEQYPAQLYLTGHGQSDFRSIAQDRARADLSKIFQVKLSEKSADSVDFKGETIDGKQQSQLQSRSSRYVSTSMEQIVSGIRIAEIWQHPHNKQYHTLAIMDRNKMSNGLRQTINQQDLTTEKEIALSQQQNELLMKINYANRSLALQRSRQANQRLLAIIDPTGIGVTPRYSLSALLADRDTLLKRLHISVEIIHDSIGDIESIVTGAVAGAGFQHELNAVNSNYVLLTSLNVDQYRDQTGWYWYRGNLQINLTNQKTAQDAGSYRWEIKVSSQRPELAIQRVRDSVDKILSTELRDTIIQLGLAQ